MKYEPLAPTKNKLQATKLFFGHRGSHAQRSTARTTTPAACVSCRRRGRHLDATGMLQVRRPRRPSMRDPQQRRNNNKPHKTATIARHIQRAADSERQHILHVRRVHEASATSSICDAPTSLVVGAACITTDPKTQEQHNTCTFAASGASEHPESKLTKNCIP